MTQEQIARKAGITRQAVGQQLKRGKTIGQILNGAGRRLGERGRPAEDPLVVTDSKGKAYTATAAEIRNKLAVAEKNEMDLAKMRGEVLPAAPLKAWFAGCIIRAREIAAGIKELADRVRQAPDEITAREIIDSEMRRMFGELEKYALFTAPGFAEEKAKPTTIIEPAVGVAVEDTMLKQKAKTRLKGAKK